MNGWQKTTLEEITDKIGDGLHGTPKYSIDGQYFFINGSNLQDGEIVINVNTKRINHDEYTKIKKNLTNRTILVAINGTLGNVGIYKGEKIALGKSACYLNVKDEINLHFVRYVIEHTNFQQYAGQYATGATIKNLSLRAVRDFSFILPPKEQQDLIESIISFYNILIENNQKRISILEEIAQRMYTEWFVKFKFPGHENVKLVKSGTEFGEIPEGWEIKSLPDQVDFLEGPGIRNWQYREFGIRFLNIRTMSNGDILLDKCSFLDPEETDNKYKHFLLKEGDIVVSSSGTLGRIVEIRKLHLPLCLNTSIVRYRNMEGKVPISYIWQFLHSKYFQDKILSMASGSAQLNYGPSHLKLMNIIKPNDELLSTYDNFVSKLQRELRVLRDVILVSKSQRDLLIENLVTGKRLLKN